MTGDRNNLAAAAAWEAYRNAMGGVSETGSPLPTWVELLADASKAALVKAWIASVESVQAGAVESLAPALEARVAEIAAIAPKPTPAPSQTAIFREPIPFEEAIASRAARALLPTRLTSEELMRLRPAIREQATFSAQVSSARHVQEIADIIDRMQLPTDGIDFATGMQRLRDSAKELGFDPDGSKNITNLASDQRVRLQVEFNNTRARAAGQHAQRQDKVSLNLWPAQEFLRVEDRKEIRDWPARWKAASGQFFDGPSDYPAGRMIALMNDPIWEKISVFGVPFAPFDWGSGMGVMPVDRNEAEELGLIQPDEEVIPEDTLFPEPESKVNLSPDLQEQVLEDLGPGYGFVDSADGKVLQKL